MSCSLNHISHSTFTIELLPLSCRGVLSEISDHGRMLRVRDYGAGVVGETDEIAGGVVREGVAELDDCFVEAG